MERSSSLRALGLGLIFVGITIVMAGGILLLLSLFLSADNVWDMTPPGVRIEDNPLSNIIGGTVIWATIVIYGLVYTYAATRFREFELWSRRAIVVLSVMLPLLECFAMASIFPPVFDRNTIGIFFLPSLLSTAVPVGILVWYLSTPGVREYFINS